MPERSNFTLLSDGRTLGYARFGAAAGAPLLFMHGFPSSRLEAELLDGPARALGISLFAPDRPGFGLSDFQPDRAIVDWPDDVAELADALRLDRFWILGGSGGCPYALACAHRLGSRVIGVATVAGLGPATDKEIVRQMGPAARLALAMANRAPSVFAFVFGGLARLVARYPGLNFRLNRATRPDREVIARPEMRAILERSVREAFRQGTDGAVHELALLAAPWGFGIDRISTPLHVWHGLEDGVVPPATARVIAGSAKNAQLRLLRQEGHLSLPTRHGAEILDALVSSSAGSKANP